MTGITLVEEATAIATTGYMLVTFTSGGEQFLFHLPANIALKFRKRVIDDAWQVCCAPDAEVVTFKAKRRKGGKS